jgi:hypothetical protein
LHGQKAAHAQTEKTFFSLFLILLKGACPHLDHLNVEGSWGVGNQGLAALAGKDGGMVRRRKDDIFYLEKKKSRNLIRFWFTVKNKLARPLCCCEWNRRHSFSFS